MDRGGTMPEEEGLLNEEEGGADVKEEEEDVGAEGIALVVEADEGPQEEGAEAKAEGIPLLLLLLSIMALS